MQIDCECHEFRLAVSESRTLIRVKGSYLDKAFPVHVIMAYRGNKSVAPLSFNLCTRSR
jgi:hypothetical protein